MSTHVLKKFSIGNLLAIFDDGSKRLRISYWAFFSKIMLGVDEGTFNWVILFFCLFFEGKLIKFAQKFTLSRFDFKFLRKGNFISLFFKGRQNPLSDSESVKATKNVMDF